MHQFHMINHHKRFGWNSCNRLIGRNWKNSFTKCGMPIVLFCFFLWVCLQQSNAQNNQNKRSEILVLDNKNVDSILGIREAHLIFFWGTWCKPCYASLDTLLNMDLRGGKIKTMVLAESHSSMQILEKVFREYDLAKTGNIVFGLLHPIDYKKSHNKNIKIFNRFICKSCVEESKEDLRFSAVFIFDKDKRLLYYNKMLVSDEYNLIRQVIKSL